MARPAQATAGVQPPYPSHSCPRTAEHAHRARAEATPTPTLGAAGVLFPQATPLPEVPGRTEYRPRDPTESVITTLLVNELDRFIEATESEDDASHVPAFVIDGLRAISRCGDLTHGFLRVACDRCDAPRIVPFSCKNPPELTTAARAYGDPILGRLNESLRSNG